MKTLKLFNCVLKKESNHTSPYLSTDGFIIEPSAMWAKTKILNYYENSKLTGLELNKTFHKSWGKIVNSTAYELMLEQLKHYVSTYGSNFTSEMYIPEEVLNVPKLKLKFQVIQGLSKAELTNKCLSMLKSGIALTEETVDDLISILVDELDYSFTGKENLKNKEAIVKIADAFGVYPDSPKEFLRFLIYKATGKTLLIKNAETISAIKDSNYNPSIQIKAYGMEKLSSIFRREKPLFLAFKNKCAKTINKLAKLAKKYHEPMVSNPLNEVTNRLIEQNELHWLDNATPFALFKALSALYNRINNQTSFVYKIRSGKSWAKRSDVKGNTEIKTLYSNYNTIFTYLKNNYSLDGMKAFIPLDVIYALPTSEKMYVGNIPTGTKFIGNQLVVGIYWENSWGANDLDLSGLNVKGKIGWNSAYKQDGVLMYSGDMTYAPNGAVEYLHAKSGLAYPTLIKNNVYNGEHTCGYKIIIGRGDDITYDYMMNPNNLFAEVKCNSVQRDTILGMMMPHGNEQSFVIMNLGAGNLRVSGNSPVTKIANEALYQEWSNPLSFNEIIVSLGAELVSKEHCDMDFSLDALEKDSFTRIFRKSEKVK